MCFHYGDGGGWCLLAGPLPNQPAGPVTQEKSWQKRATFGHLSGSTPFPHELSSRSFAVCKPSSSQRLMCLDDLWQWLSGTLEAHPISRFRFSFLVIYGTYDEFSPSADMFHNCQNFDWSGSSEKKVWKEKKEKKTMNNKAPSPHFPPRAQNCFRWSSQPHHLATQWLADLAKDSSVSFYSLVPAFAGPRILLVVAFSSPDGKSCWKWHFGENFEAFFKSLARLKKKKKKEPFKVHLSGACLDSIKLLPLSQTWCGLFCFCFYSISQHSLAGMQALQVFGCFYNLENCSVLWSSPHGSASKGQSGMDLVL